LELTRRWFLGTTLAGFAGAVVCPAHPSEPLVGRRLAPQGLSTALLQRALDALERHRGSIAYRDFMGVADFSHRSSLPRFHVINLSDGTATSHLVAHGRGSDPARTGWLQRFSNQPRSQATSAGAYRTGGGYVGEHGRSLRLEGLDPSNDNAASRAIVVHAAWYVSTAMVGHFGMLGRSEGCFAVASSSLGEVLDKLGPGRLIYADKV
jgi:hypothetical protein